MNLLSQDRSEAGADGRHLIELEPYGYRWLREGDMERPVPDDRTRGTRGS
jgi:maltose alpha-D-glucosyltransferase/alpha-amylase